ncbi:MAG: glycosyltransferase family 2 protein [Anaerolineae bacterium]|nr:glycosyltransferase family 2 protein [Anaerolineae bacterium]
MIEGHSPKILVIIPAFNEGPRVGAVVRSVYALFPKASVLVIDDCSTDNTREQALKAGALTVSHPFNLGYASALETGYLYAVQHMYDIVVQMDGDGQHIAEEINKILQPVLNHEADIVIGSRYKNKSVEGYRTPLTRRLGQRFFSVIFWILTRQRITDPTSGFQCLNRKALELYIKGDFPDDFPDADMLLLAHYSGLTVREVSVRMVERSEGVSMHAGWKPVYYVLKMLLSMFMVSLNYRKMR